MDKILEKNQLKKTGIFKLCSTLDKHEMSKCLVFLCEFTSASKKCRGLFEEIYKYYKKSKYDWSRVNTDISTLNKKLFGKEEDNNASRVLRSELYRNLKRYCSFLNFQRQEKTLGDSNFLDYLAHKKVDDLFFKEYNKVDKNLENKISTNGSYVNYQSYKSYLDFVSKEQSKNNKLDYSINYRNFYNYSIIQKIQNYCFILNHHLIKKQEIPPEIEKEVTSLFHQAKQIPNIKIIAEIYETASLMLKNSKCHYNKLKELLKNTDISKDDKKLLYIFMHNFCVGSNDSDLKNESRINYLKRFDDGLLHVGEYILLMTAKALCTTVLTLTKSLDESIKMNRNDAAQKIKEIVQQMPPKHRESTEYFHLAILDYYFEDYESACKKLKNSPKYANAFFDFDARTVLQRCYYFLDDIDEFIRGISNFQAALRNEANLAENHKIEYLNFTSAINILQKANNVIDKMEKEKLLQKLDEFLQEHPVKVLAWFKKQIELIQSPSCHSQLVRR